jgi:Protein of unknown function (DUF3631)
MIADFPDLQSLARALDGEVRGEEVLCPGPGHSAADRSLSVKPDKGAPDGFLVYSFSDDDPIVCRDYARRKLGLPPFEPNGHKGGKAWTTIAEHIYRDQHGQPYLQVRKCLDENGRKQYPQAHWTDGKWRSGKPSGAKIPYRLPELLAAPAGTTVYVVEGEKCADALARLGFVSSTNSEGADDGKGKKWTAALNSWFKGRPVVVVGDNDAPGRKHAQHVAKNLHGIAKLVRVLDLAPHWPGEAMPVGDDVADWIEQHDRAGSRLSQFAREAPLWEPGAASTSGSTSSDQAFISELAALSPLDYAKRRADAAKQIGIGVTELDKLVAAARGETPPATPERWTVEPWEQEVTTADLLHALLETYPKYVILPEHGAVAMALWCLQAWAIDAAYVSPFLMFTSPEMRCGKSTALSLLYRTSPRTVFASNISPASLFRYIDSCHPVLLIDEADTFARDDEQLRGILNSGHSRDTAFVIRCEGDDNTPKEFSTWSPKAIAAIGKLAATLRDRAIILPMKRKKPGERVAKLRAQDGEPFVTLRRKAARWAGDNLEVLKAARPGPTETLNDRAQDNWELLFAIADLAGGDWPKLARNAALSLTGAEIEDATLKVQLLAAIKSVFEALAVDRVSSETLVAELVKDSDEPWAVYGKAGKPISQRQVASLLSEFKIKPNNMRLADGGQRKGYNLGWFKDAFERYDPHPPVSSVPAVPTNDVNDLEQNSSVQADSLGTDNNGSNPLKTKAGTDGTDKSLLGSKTGAACCAQCHGLADGKEQLVSIDGTSVWLHPQCQRVYAKTLEEKESLPW